MSETSQGEGWWQASDLKWYPPTSAPGREPAAGQPEDGLDQRRQLQERRLHEIQHPDELGLPAGVAVASPWLRLGSWLLEIGLMAVTLVIGWVIWALMIVGTGQTPAKRILNLRVIKADERQPATFVRMFWVRGILAGLVAMIVLPLTLYILVLMPLWDRRNQNIWDKVSTCYVVKDPADAWNTKPVLT